MVRLPDEPRDEKPKDLLAEEWLGPRWPVWPGYRIAQPGDPEWWLDRDQNWSWTGGALTKLLGKEAQMKAAEESPKWFRKPHLEVSPDNEPPAYYRPDRVAVDLLNAALDVDVASPDSLLGFVRVWGVLGVGTGLKDQAEALLVRPRTTPNIDTVWAARRALAAIQEHYHWLVALKKPHWLSDRIPRAVEDKNVLDAARALMPEPDWRALEEGYGRDWRALQFALGGSLSGGSTDPYVSGFSRRRTFLHVAQLPAEERRHWGNISTVQAHWHAFSISIEGHLRRIHPIIVWEPRAKKPTPAWRLRTPIDVLWAEVWNFATRGGRVLRCPYPRCRHWFVADHGSQIYCSPACARKAASKSWYEAKGRAQRARERRRNKRRGKQGP